MSWNSKERDVMYGILVQAPSDGANCESEASVSRCVRETCAWRSSRWASGTKLRFVSSVAF